MSGGADRWLAPPLLCLLLCSPAVFRAPEGAALSDLAAWCARGRRPAREIATREPAARSGRSRGPPWPCRRPPAPRPGSAGPAAASNRAALCRCSWLACSPLAPSNFACNSPTTLSNYEFVVLEFQRFQTLLKLHPIELHATFGWCVVLKLGQGLTPPTGTAARPRASKPARALRTLRPPPHRRAALNNFACNSPAAISGFEL